MIIFPVHEESRHGSDDVYWREECAWFLLGRIARQAWKTRFHVGVVESFERSTGTGV